MSTRRKHVLTAVFCIAALATALAQTRRPSWTYASSDHFEAYVTGDDKRARAAMAEFEWVHPAFQQLLDVPPGAARRPRIIVFGTAAAFAPYRNNDVSNAFWLGTPDGDFIVLDSLEPDAVPDAVHEYTHLMLNRAGLDYPLWLNEGLAEYYSTMTPAGTKMRVGAVPAGAIDTVTKGPMIAIDRLLAIDEQAPEYNVPGVAQVFYAESWALTHMLLTHQNYRDGAGTVLAAIALGTKSGDALTTTYKKTLTAIGSDLRNYVTRFRLATSTIDVPGLAHAANVITAPASEVDVDVTLAAVIGWRPGRADESRAAMVALEARAPDNLKLTEARGLLEIYTNNCDPARAYLAKAVALDSRNPAVLRAYAAILGASDPAQQKDLLAKAAAIAPDDAAGPNAPPIPCGR
jgi:hypothetical protein